MLSRSSGIWGAPRAVMGELRAARGEGRVHEAAAPASQRTGPLARPHRAHATACMHALARARAHARPHAQTRTPLAHLLRRRLVDCEQVERAPLALVNVQLVTHTRDDQVPAGGRLGGGGVCESVWVGARPLRWRWHAREGSAKPCVAPPQLRARGCVRPHPSPTPITVRPHPSPTRPPPSPVDAALGAHERRQDRVCRKHAARALGGQLAHHGVVAGRHAAEDALWFYGEKGVDEETMRGGGGVERCSSRCGRCAGGMTETPRGGETGGRGAEVRG